MPNGKSSSSLSAEEAEQLLAQADSRLKMAKGKAMMKQVTEEEVRALFDDLERVDGLLYFHQMQERIGMFALLELFPLQNDVFLFIDHEIPSFSCPELDMNMVLHLYFYMCLCKTS
jgi:hypothetical protein